MKTTKKQGSLIRLAKVGAGTLLVLAAFFTAASFVSCDDDDDEESYVESFAASDSYGTALQSSDAAYPVSGAEDAPIDGYMRLTFSSKPSLTKGACIYIYKDGGDDGDDELVDTISFAGEYLTGQTTGSTVYVDDQLVYVDGTGVYFMPHYGVLDYGTTYYVVIPVGAIKGTLNDGSADTAFGSTGLAPSSKSWSFTTRSAPTVSTSTAITIDAAESTGDSQADFRTVHGALDAIGSSSGSYTLSVAAGDYKELVSWKGNASITITGQGTEEYGSDVVIHWRNYQGYNGSSSTRPSFYYGGKDLVLENITLQNDFDRSLDTGNTQAETLYFNSKSCNLAAYNCSFLSHQDTLLTKGKNWFYQCYIEGDVDFIWGYADAALFEECELVCVYDSNATSHSAYIFETRVGTVSSDTSVGKGYVIFNSTVTIEKGTTAYYGRRASSGSSYYDQAALVDVTISGSGTLAGAHWYVGNEPCALKDTLYGDYADVGWKEYNVTSSESAVSTTNRTQYAGDIVEDEENSKQEYTYEYSGRYTILNRVFYITDSGGYYDHDSTSNIWDYSDLESAWNATTDASPGADGTYPTTTSE